MRIKDLSAAERPREKMLARGAALLQNPFREKTHN